MKRSGTLGRRHIVAALAAAPLMSCGRRAGAEFRTLTEEEASLVGAVCDRLIPPDSAPGATQAGVVHYIDIQLGAKYKRFRQAYRNGLNLLSEASRQQHGKTFPELSGSQQTALLAAWESGDERQRQFFEMILAHTMQGFYGSPRHGGNRDAASWRMLGVPDPPVRGRLHYEL